jgi:hypothetical protein
MYAKVIFFLFLSFSICFSSWAQIDYSNKSTNKLKKSPELTPEKDNPQKRLLSIYTKDTRKILYGNPCMDAVTERFGFEYVVMPNNAPGFNAVNKFFHNAGVKTLLFFRNPLWGIITKKKVKECRQKTGDYNG